MKVTTPLLFSRLLISSSDSRPQRRNPSSLLYVSASGMVSKMEELGGGVSSTSEREMWGDR